MARVIYCSVMHFANFFVFVLIALCAASASPDGTKTVEFNVKPGGVQHTFSETIVSRLQATLIRFCYFELKNVIFNLHI